RPRSSSPRDRSAGRLRATSSCPKQRQALADSAIRSSRSAEPRVQRIAQAVAKHVERADGEQDREAREEREPGLGADEVPALADHDAPLGWRRLRPEADEAEPCPGDDRRGPGRARLVEAWPA